MAQHVVSRITITYDPQVLQEIIENLEFPMLAFDFESYNFRKDYQLYDHHAGQSFKTVFNWKNCS